MKKKIEFDDLDFDSFKDLAKDNTLSKYKKIGFPDHYREGYEEKIFNDIKKKILTLNESNKFILDIGSGCSDLSKILIDHCSKLNHHLLLVDSEEMLDLTPEQDFIKKIPGQFPIEMGEFIKEFSNKVDAILIYSVIQYVVAHTCVFSFIDNALSLLKAGGYMLIGDIPNISMRKRFLSSPEGVKYHQDFMKTMSAPQVNFNCIEPRQIDDSIILALINRCRVQGFNAYILPQSSDLPMSNRREDILVYKP